MTVPLLMKKLLMTVCCLGLAATCSAQDQRFVMKLNNGLVDSLKSFGSLKSIVPENARDKIGFVELQFEDSVDTTPVELNLGLTVDGNVAKIVLDNGLIAQIKGQPIRVVVNEANRGFSEVLLIYDAPSAASQLPVVNDAEGNPLEMMYIRLDDTKVMAGGVDGLNKIDLKTKFGDVTIPMDQVAGIRFHIDKNDSAVVVLVNGDSVTGVPQMPDMSLTTDWGTALVETEFVRSLTTTPDSRFREETTDFGPRWVLDTGTSLAPGALPR